MPQHFRASPSPHRLSSAQRTLYLSQEAQFQTLPGSHHHLANTNLSLSLSKSHHGPLFTSAEIKTSHGQQY